MPNNATADLFKSQVGDLKTTNKKFTPQERDLKKEIFNKIDPVEVVDAYEREMGMLPKKEGKAEPTEFKNKILNPTNTTDAELLNKLLNDQDFSIIYWKDNWGQDGGYAIFVIYSKVIKEEENGN